MRIGIDISQIAYKGTGVSRFTLGLIDSILKYDTQNSWTFLFYSLRQNLEPKLEKRILEKKHRLIKWPLPPTLASFIFNIIHFPISSSLDWFITSDWNEIPFKKIKKATIVHDLVFKRYPETVNKKIIKTQEIRLNHVVKESKIIFADSLVTKNDLINFYNIDSNKIVVNYPGVEIKIPKISEIKQTLTKYKINKSFILAVGKIEPRKNIKNLIEAFNKINKTNLSLIIVGPKGWDDISYKLLKDIKNKNIRFLGMVSNVELFSLYSKALAFISPSIWEGFGYPLVEAMTLGTPLICSNIPPYKEIAGSSAYYFNPLKPNEIVQIIQKVLTDNQLKKSLIESGKIRAVNFNWHKYYQILIDTLYDNRS